MGLASRLAVILALAAGVMAASIPPQLPMRLPLSLAMTTSRSVGDLRHQTPRIYRGKDIYDALHSLTNDMDKGLPQGWEKLTRAPTTDGTFAVETVDSQSLDKAIQNWKLDESLLNQVKKDIRTLIEVAAEEAVYVAQHFTYALPRCDAGERPACLTTLLAVVRAKVADDDTLQSAEVAHMFIHSGASTIAQTRQYRTCHDCWLVLTCCSDHTEVRGLMPEEIQTVNKVLSTNQATWARTNGLLRQFVQNKHENRDVFKKQESRLLAALQDDMRLHHQNITKTSVSVNDQGAVPLLENMVANCFQKAVGEPIVEWLKRVRGKNPDQTISLECSVSSQRKEVIDPPMNGCRSTIEVTSMTLFSWVILSPQSTLIDALTIQSALNVSHTECEPLPPSDDRDNADDCVEGIDFASPEREVFEGAIVRWSIMQPDGSFNPVHYKRNWREYSGYVNKAMLDILRYSAAAAYLGITIPSLDHLSAMPEYGTTKLDPESLAAFGSIIKKFAEGWSSAAIPLKPSIHQNFGLKVCLGFEQYDDTSKAAAISGIHPSNLMKAVEHVIQAAQLPDDKDIKSIMMGVKYSDNEFTWTSESITYMGPDGKNRFLYLTKHANPKTNKIDLIYGMVNSEFSLAPDILVVHEKWSMLWGTFGGGRTYYRKVPHVVTLEDAKILEMYFEMIVLHKMAMVTGLPVPQHPDLTVFCDK